MPDRIWTAWLPPDLKHAAVHEEPKRFAKAVELFCADAEAAKASTNQDRLAPTLKWIDVLKR
jgi:hypothetical protein